MRIPSPGLGPGSLGSHIALLSRSSAPHAGAAVLEWTMARHPMPQSPSPSLPRRPFVSLTRVARTAAVLLLATWFGPVTLEQTAPLLRGAVAPAGAAVGAVTDGGVVPAGEGLVLTTGTPIELRLRDGRVLRGRFLGRALQDSAAYAARFAAAAAPAGGGAFSLGESLRVVTLDGHETVAPFGGWAELALLLRGPASAPTLHVPFEFVRSIERADGSPVDVRQLERAFRDHVLPSADVLVLGAHDPVGTDEERWASALRVPADDIASVRGPSTAGKGVPGLIVFVVGVTAFVLIIKAMHDDHSSRSSGCEDVNWGGFGGWSGYSVTERPFDLGRGRFVDDPVARAEVWSDATPVAAR